jgi:hypothetical protein
MNSWEIASWAASRAARDTDQPASYQPTVLQSQQALFDLYCTQKDRAHGRQGSFGRPPEYDPATEKVIHVEIAGSVAIVETERSTSFAGGRYKYRVKRVGGKWLIESCKHLVDGRWLPSILCIVAPETQLTGERRNIFPLRSKSIAIQ